MDDPKLKVLMLPWLAHGHVSPYLELSKRLINKHFFIYFCSTPIILTSIKEKINEKQSKSIQLVELHLTPSPELPPDHHTTKNIPNHLIPKLREALNSSAPSFDLILELLKPDLVVYDIFQPWAATLSSSRGIPAVQLLTSGAAIVSFALHKMTGQEKEFPFKKLTPRYFQNYAFRGGKRPPEKQNKFRSELTEGMKKSSEIVLIKTFEELEGGYFDYLGELLEKKVVPVGPLVESPSETGGKGEMMTWLDKKEEGSVVFVSFGSECFLTKEEIEEVALGLELSNVNFLWVIRFPVDEETKADDVLPKGFLERVGGRGMIWQSWAPQINILAHPSIGGFITHCGWSSIMESMGMGVPILALPLHMDQPFNARLVEDVGVGVEIWRDENNGAMKGEEIAKTIRHVMIEKDGEGVRDEAKKISETMNLKEEERIDVVVKELRKLCKEKK